MQISRTSARVVLSGSTTGPGLLSGPCRKLGTRAFHRTATLDRIAEYSVALVVSIAKLPANLSSWHLSTSG